MTELEVLVSIRDVVTAGLALLVFLSAWRTIKRK